LRLFLVYINYLNNVYRVSNKERAEAALAFHRVFLKKEP
jgi:ribosomal protein L31E